MNRPAGVRSETVQTDRLRMRYLTFLASVDAQAPSGASALRG